MAASFDLLAQTRPDFATIVITICILVLVVIISALVSPNSKSALKEKKGRAASKSLSQKLTELSTTSFAPSAISDHLESILNGHFKLSLIQYGRVKSNSLILDLNIQDGTRLQQITLKLPHSDFPISVEDRGQQETPETTFQRQEISQRMVLPLTQNGEVLGVLAVRPQDGHSFDQDGLISLNQIAIAAASAIYRHRLQAELERRTTQLVLLSEISRRMISLKPLNERWQDIITLISQTFEFAEVEIFEIRDGKPILEASSHMAQGPETDREHIQTADVILECLDTSGWVERESFDGGRASHQLAIPMQVQEKQLGVFFLERGAGTSFTPEEIALGEMLASLMAMAILEARNYTQQQEYNWYNTVMLEVTKHAARPGDPMMAIRAVLQLTTMLVGARWTLLLLPDEHGERLLLGPSSGVPHEIDKSSQSLQLDLDDFELVPPHVESELPYRLHLPEPLSHALDQVDCLAMDLSDGKSLLGLLLIDGTVPPGTRMDLIGGIAHQLSMRIENSRLIDNLATQRSMELELETARNIQESFMPRSLPQMGDWQVGATWLAARQVGGDFYDFIPLQPTDENNPCWGVVIADVADKGVPAALFMALCRTLLRSIAPSVEDPADALKKLNQLILSDTHTDLFVSLFYGIWQPKHGKIFYANGGHNPPLLFTPKKPAKTLEGSGMVLGVSNQARYQTHEISLGTGDVLVMFTDGVTEAMSQDGDFFGRQGIIETVEQVFSEPAQAIADQLSQTVKQFSTRLDPQDDLTTVVVKRARESDV